MDLLKELNDSQRAAVEYNDSPLLVIAGAGSGKTRVLTYKIAYLLEQGVKPWNILALTFTNKAANEMKQRIGNIVGNDVARYLNMGTFHSIFSRILRVEGGRFGFNSNFTIYDESDSRSLIKSIIKEMKLDDKIYKPASVRGLISMAKNHLILPAQYANDKAALERDEHNRMPDVHKIYTAYMQRCQKANSMDFDDLLVMTYILFRDNPDVKNKYADKFQYVLVDEYQDTNSAQQSIVLQLTKGKQHVCVVGDDAQSIYGFRGADVDNILDFQGIYKDVKLLKLEQNYRSTQHIVQAANSLISHNKRQIHKDVYSRNAEGEKVILKQACSDKEEAMIVCKDIRKIKQQDKCEYSDFAILYRTNAQSRSFEEEMRKQSIPYRIFGGLSFYQRKEIKDIVAYFRLVANHNDEEALKRIINYPTRGIGDTTVGKIAESAQKNGVSLWDVISSPVHYRLEINKGTAGKLAQFTALINSFIDELSSTDAYELGRRIIIASGVRADLLSGTDPESLARQENLDEFVGSMQSFVQGRKEEGRLNEIYLTDYLQDISLISDLDSEGDEESRVMLMTVHAAKGLEFPTVFIVGLEENIFPSPMSCDNAKELEEERRLLYVAITRAEKHCIMTCAKNRFRYGNLQFDTPSRFLRDIDPSLISIQSETDMDDMSGRYFGSKSSRSTSDDFHIDKPYTGSRPWGNDYPDYGNKVQNSRPVAGQFKADVKPKITNAHKAEKAVDPFSLSFKELLAAKGANMRKVSDTIGNGGRTANQSATANSNTTLREGSVIEHQRFGIGTVTKIEGTGENTKATVAFKNTGTKQLLLKFAKFNIIS